MSRQAYTVQEPTGDDFRLCLRLLTNSHRRETDVLQHRFVGKKIELLEHHANTLANACQSFLFAKLPVCRAWQFTSVDNDLPL